MACRRGCQLAGGHTEGRASARPGHAEACPSGLCSWNVSGNLEQSICANRQQKHRADECIRIEEGAIDCSEVVELARAAVLVNECGRDWNHGGEINRAQLRSYPEGNQRHQHHKMKNLRDAQTGDEPEPNNERVQAFLSIEVVILRRVNQIKSADPADDAKSKDERRQVHMAGLCDPSCDWCNTERKTEKEMRRVGEVFGHGIEKNDGECDRRERESQAIDICGKENKKDAAEDE
jgi:hypothetical protein